jgi:hypothetical protein
VNHESSSVQISSFGEAREFEIVERLSGRLRVRGAKLEFPSLRSSFGEEVKAKPRSRDATCLFSRFRC